MKTVETILRQMTDTNTIMQDLKAALRTMDPEFGAGEERFQKASEKMERVLGDTISPSAAEYLAAKEEAFAAELIYMGWQGFQFNMDIFRNPVNALLLKGDYEELLQERRLSALPMAGKAREVIRAFHAELRKLPEETQNLTEDIVSFYTYLETTGYKLAHYFGFRLADKFLPYVLPGYTEDSAATMRYAANLRNYLGLDPDRMV